MIARWSRRFAVHRSGLTFTVRVWNRGPCTGRGTLLSCPADPRKIRQYSNAFAARKVINKRLTNPSTDQFHLSPYGNGRIEKSSQGS